MELKAFYAQTPVRRLFFIAALPGTVSMLASSLYYLIDGILVGNLLGETAFAAVNLALPLVFINFSLADLVGVGSAVPISISLGRRSDAEANNAFTCAVLTIEVSGTLMGLLFYVLAPELVAMMGAEGQLAADATAYLRTYVICSPLTSIVFAMDNYLRICGRVRQSMLLNILMSVLCAGCEYVFLGVLHWGVWAAALANSVGMAVCALLALWPFLRGKMQLRFVRPRFTGALLKRIAACGSPTFLNNVAGRLIAIVMNALLLALGGETAVSVYGVMMYAESLVLPVMYGVCDSLQPAVSYNLGARNFDRVRGMERCCFVACAVVSLLAAGLLLVFPETTSRLFVGDAQDVLEMSVTALRLYALTFITRWVSFACQSYLSALGQSGAAAAISVSVALLLPAAFIALLWPLGLNGIWLNSAAVAAAAGVLAALLLKSRLKKALR